MSLQISGIIKSIGDREVKGSKGFTVRNLVLEVPDEKYPQIIQIQFNQSSCDILDMYKAGTPVNVFFNIRGREWEGRIFTSLVGWKITPGEGIADLPMNNAGQVDEFEPNAMPLPGEDGLPF